MPPDVATRAVLPKILLFYQLESFPTWMMHLLTWKSWLKTGLPPTAVNLLAEVNSHETFQMLTLMQLM